MRKITLAIIFVSILYISCTTTPVSVIPQGMLVTTGIASSWEPNARDLARSRARLEFAHHLQSEVSALVTGGSFMIEEGDFWAWEQTVYRVASNVNLRGVRISREWQDREGYFHAEASLDRETAVGIYPQIIRANLQTIENFTNMTEQDRHSLRGFSRYMAAANLADDNFAYVTLLAALGIPMHEIELRLGAVFRLAARNIAMSLPVGVEVSGEPSGRIRGVFASAITDAGLLVASSASRYVLNVQVSMEPISFPASTWAYSSRMFLRAELIDTHAETILLSYDFLLNEHGNTQAGADESAVIIAVRRIREEFTGEQGEFAQFLARERRTR